MSQEVIAAVITGTLGLVTGLMVGFKDEIVMMIRRPQRNLSELWVGTACDIEVEPYLRYKHKLNYSFRFQIKQHGRRVTREGSVESE